jgi:hypothetical protein
LREAIIAANASPREITFASTLTAGGPAVIDLLTALPAINANVQVQGPGANLLTIERSTAGGTPDFRIFLINTGKGLTISGVTIARGKPSSAATFPFNSGGNFLNDHGTLTINNCVVSNALSGGGILNLSGVLAINGSTISGNAGNGLLNTMPQSAANSPASATINNSTFSGNLGSGIRNNTDIGPASSPLTVLVTNSTISGNTISSGGSGAAITNASQVSGTAIINLINTTISGNTGTGSGGVGGIYNIGIFGGGANPSVAKVILTNSTVFGNSTLSGPDNAGGLNDIINSCVGCVVTTQLRNSIVAGNTVSGSPSDIVGAVDSTSSFNLIGTGGSGGLVNGTNGNQVGVASPGLGPLANNGGPTQTHALLSTSPALDAGDNCVTQAAHCSDSNISQLTTDQRGFSRIVDGPDGDATATVDIGAYEMQSALASLPDTSTNEDTQLVVSFDAGDASTITSVTATSSNPTVVPNDSAHLLAANNGSQGSVTINPAANASGLTNITITINRTVGGPDVKTFALTVNPVNDAPTFTKGPDQTINEDAGAQTISNWASNISPGPADESGQTLSFFVTNNNTNLFFAAPSIDASGTLTYRANADANGTATVTILVKDNGGTANGGVDSTSVSFVITVNSVNDAPVFTKGPDRTVLEDAFISSTSWATNIGAGATNESSQTLTFVVTNNTNPALFSAGPAVNPQGFLSYTLAANANGAATITLVLKDNGGTANGGVDTSAAQTFTINVVPVNDPPTFTKGPDQTVNEDAGAQTVNNWATSISAGAPDEASQTLTFVLSNSNGTLFSAPPAVSANGTLTYTPAADANGTATVTVTLKDSGDTANGGSNVSGSTNFLITVRSVNDPPTFTKGADQTVNEDAGAQTVAGWASAISPGPSNESAQTVTFTATNDNNALFSVQPAISSTGTLTYTPASNVNGVANLSVTLKDSGGTANGGVDTSAPQTFTITLNAANDAPSFTKGADQTVNNNTGAQTVTNWATSISAGPANESSQSLSFQITGNTNSGLFSVQPAISSAGTLTYTPAANQGGTATITTNLKDDGGTSNGGVDTSGSASFNITVTPVGGFVNFASSSANTTENSGSTTVNVARSGDSSSAVTVNYATNADAGVPCSTANGVASPKCDFTAALGSLSFAAGETSKPITILLSQDSFVEGPENLTLTLSNPTGGAALGTTSSMSVTIADDVTEPPTNIIDDPNMFVRMHYHDFLNREGDQSGINFWTGQMTNCGNSDVTVCRVNVSGAFFLSIEFQQTGYLVERVYKTAYGDATATSQLGGSHQILVPVVRANEFLTDTQRIGRGVVVLQPGWEQVLENNKQAYALEFVQNSRFVAALPTTMTPAQFVDKLNQNAGNVLAASERTTAINLFGNAADTTNVNARAQALRQVAEDQDLYNAEFNRAFVLTEYIGYLRRNPNDAPESTLDYTGYDFWLNKLNENGGDYIKAEMVKAFISSDEYRHRFGQ